MHNQPIQPQPNQVFAPEQTGFRALPQRPDLGKLAKMRLLMQQLLGQQPERMGRMGSY